MTAVAPLVRPARVLRLEIRRSVVPWAIPLIAALFFFDAFRTAVGFAPVWTVRSSVITSNMITDFGPFAAGLAAWVASREGRRHIGDLLATTVRPAWVRQAAALGGTLFWLLLTFLIGVAALYIDTARLAPARYRRGEHHILAALGGPANVLGGHDLPGGARVRRLRRGRLPCHRPAGDLGRAAVVARGGRRRDGGHGLRRWLRRGRPAAQPVHRLADGDRGIGRAAGGAAAAGRVVLRAAVAGQRDPRAQPVR
jgi:hypothetical protein